MKKPNLGTPPPNSCPVCGIQLSSNELETHFLAELDRLYKLSSGPERQRIRTSFNLNPAMHPNNGMMQGPDSRWEVSISLPCLIQRSFGDVLNCNVQWLIADISTYPNKSARAFKGENSKAKG